MRSAAACRAAAEHLLEQPRVAERAAREHAPRPRRSPVGLADGVRACQATAQEHRRVERAHELSRERIVRRAAWRALAGRGCKEIAATPASLDEPPREQQAAASPARRPERSFTVTGSPLPARAARATATARSGPRAAPRRRRCGRPSAQGSPC